MSFLPCGGAVFMLRPPRPGETGWSETKLHPFTGGADGANPLAGLIMDASGALYGTTYWRRRAAAAIGCGTVFKLTPPAAGETRWTETVLYAFTGGADGGNPAGRPDHGHERRALRHDSPAAATMMHGTVFKLTPPAPGKTRWTETVLYAFTGGARRRTVPLPA